MWLAALQTARKAEPFQIDILGKVRTLMEKEPTRKTRDTICGGVLTTGVLNSPVYRQDFDLEEGDVLQKGSPYAGLESTRSNIYFVWHKGAWRKLR